MKLLWKTCESFLNFSFSLIVQQQKFARNQSNGFLGDFNERHVPGYLKNFLDNLEAEYFFYILYWIRIICTTLSKINIFLPLPTKLFWVFSMID